VKPTLEDVQKEMLPGVITRDGFLGSDPRTLEAILQDDNETVRGLGLTHALIAAKMRALMQAGLRGLGTWVAVAPHFVVLVDSVRGVLPCPFLHEGTFPKTRVTVKNTRLGREITFTELNVHLIEAHGFYEGQGAPFRLDPPTLAQVLEISGPETNSAAGQSSGEN